MGVEVGGTVVAVGNKLTAVAVNAGLVKSHGFKSFPSIIPSSSVSGLKGSGQGEVSLPSAN